VTGAFAVEARMTIAEGETVNFVEVTREAWDRAPVELALTDSSDPAFEDVVVVPGALLRKGGRIQNDELPVDIEVLEYLDNSALVDAHDAPDAEGPTFTSVAGHRIKIVPRKEESGTSSERSDVPTVRVRFLKKGTDQVLGTRLLSLWFSGNSTQRENPALRFPPQRLRAGGQTY